MALKDQFDDMLGQLKNNASNLGVSELAYFTLELNMVQSGIPSADINSMLAYGASKNYTLAIDYINSHMARATHISSNLPGAPYSLSDMEYVSNNITPEGAYILSIVKQSAAAEDLRLQTIQAAIVQIATMLDAETSLTAKDYQEKINKIMNL